MSPFLTVIIPIYNGEKYLNEAVMSVLNQPCHDLEIILINDGSKDTSDEIAKRLSGKFDNVLYLSHENHGTGYTRNIGIKKSRGKAIIFLDQDDIMLGGFYTEKIKNFISYKFENGVDIIAPARLIGNETMDSIVIRNVKEEECIGNNRTSWKGKFEFFTNIYSQRLFLEENLKFLEYRVDMESLFTHSALYLSQKTIFTNKIYFSIRRENPNSVSHTWNLVKVLPIKMDAWIDVINWHKSIRGNNDQEVILSCEKKYAETLNNLVRIFCINSMHYDELDKLLSERKGYSNIKEMKLRNGEAFKVYNQYNKNHLVFSMKQIVVSILKKIKNNLKMIIRKKINISKGKDLTYWENQIVETSELLLEEIK